MSPSFKRAQEVLDLTTISVYYKDRFLYNDNADNIWRAPTLRLPKGNLTQQPQQLVSTTFQSTPIIKDFSGTPQDQLRPR